MRFFSEDFVKLTKIAQINPSDIPIGYWSKGWLLFNLAEGESVYTLRFSRSKRYEGESDVVEIGGLFNTSCVHSIRYEADHAILTTSNSEWKIEHSNKTI